MNESAAGQETTLVKRWRMTDGELHYVGEVPAPRPRDIAVEMEQDELDPDRGRSGPGTVHFQELDCRCVEPHEPDEHGHCLRCRRRVDDQHIPDDDRDALDQHLSDDEQNVWDGRP
jgi:hypothetical protein